MTPPPLSHNLSHCFPSSDIPWHDIGEDWPGPCQGKILRALDDGSVRSALIRLPAGFNREGGDPIPATVQGFVLSGTATLGPTPLRDYGFFALPTGCITPSLASEHGGTLLMIFDDVRIAAPNAAEPVVLRSAPEIEPIIPVINGVQMKGFERRVLWEDANSGADTRLLTVPPGFEGHGPNWHPVHEEIFCLTGDIGPDDTRLMTPGTYLHNPAFCVHGYHEHSNGGATILEWHDARWAINFV